MAYVNLGQVVYPVGSVYMSYTNVFPASFFGENWTAITGRFPYFNNGTSTEGANSVDHSHNLNGTGFADIDVITSGKWFNVCYRNGANHSFTPKQGWAGLTNDILGSAETNTHSIDLSGTMNSSSINDMPAYQTFYAWHRTS